MKKKKYMAALLILTLGAYGLGSPALAATTTVSHPLYGESHTLTGQDASGLSPSLWSTQSLKSSG